MRPLAPRTEKRYAEILITAFDAKPPSPETLNVARVKTWSESSKNQLRCALTRFYKETGQDKPKVFETLLERTYAIQRLPVIPTEEDVGRFESVAKDAKIQERFAVQLLLFLGLRAEELCMLERHQVEAALRDGTLTFVRKGGREAQISIEAVRPLFVELLTLSWDTAGQTLSRSKNPRSQYAALRRAVQKIAKLAQIDKISPHKLRHAFATRLNHDGASIFTVQAALNHKNIATTMRYVHPSTADVAKHLRGPTNEKKTQVPQE